MSQEIHLHFHFAPDNSNILSEKLDFLTLKFNEFMTKQERFDTILTKLDAVTTDLAGDFKTFIDEVKNDTVSDASMAKAEANVTILEQLAASKENPIPNEPPIPPVDTEEGQTGAGVNQANNPTLG
jgi:hypothetical protein